MFRAVVISSGRVAQWIRRRSSEPKIVGSSPTVVNILPQEGGEHFEVKAVPHKTAHRGARTHDHQLKRLALYQLS